MPKVIHTVGNMVDIPDSASIALHENENSIIFVGKMSYEPNVVAVTFFSTKIFPSLKARYPELKFIIVGANPDERVQRLSGQDGVVVTGFVDSVEPYFRDSTLVVAPMLTGAGIQNKIIQAMSYGCCVATTAIGAEGLTIHDNEIAIINSPDEWVSVLLNLLSDKGRRKEMGAKAREYIKSNLSREVISRQFWTFINSV